MLESSSSLRVCASSTKRGANEKAEKKGGTSRNDGECVFDLTNSEIIKTPNSCGKTYLCLACTDFQGVASAGHEIFCVPCARLPAKVQSGAFFFFF
jgi:hypothetical protein